MSRVEMHAPFTTFSGTIGKLVYRKFRGKTIVAMKPDADRPLSQAEVAHRQDFAQAATWAKAALQNEELRPFYEALGKQREIPPRAAAMADFLKRPSIEALDLANYAGKIGNRIYFMATDNGGVVSAQVTITDADGNLIENGMAVEVDAGTGYWMYTAKSAVAPGTLAVINVQASDRPGNFVVVGEEKAL